MNSDQRGLGNDVIQILLGRFLRPRVKNNEISPTWGHTLYSGGKGRKIQAPRPLLKNESGDVVKL